MISLHITIYETEDGDRFRVNMVDSAKPTEVTDVTDRYDVAATETIDGRTGFTVIPKAEARHPIGAEL